jgi:hypothetical protein
MNKKTKKISIKRIIHEVIEIQQHQQIVMYCENCLSEQNFKVIETNQDKTLEKGNEINKLSKLKGIN